MTANKDQQLVFNWIKEKLNLPNYANGYLGAIIQINNKPPGYITFVSHYCRDLMNGLARDLNGVQGKHLDYKQHVNKIEELWNSKWSYYDSGIKENEVTHFEIPSDVCNHINNLIKNHKDATLRSNEKAVKFFDTFLDYQDINDIPPHFLAEWNKAREFFLSLTHLNGKEITAEKKRELPVQFNIIDKYLLIAAKSEYERLKRLDEILQQTNP